MSTVRTATAANEATPLRPTLRDKSMDYSARYLFGNRFEVSGNGRRYYVESTFFDGDFIAKCRCPDKLYNKAVTCKHEEAVIRSERYRVATVQFNWEGKCQWQIHSTERFGRARF